MTATRRLAAILAADVAGYSRLIGADEGGTRQRSKALFEKSSIARKPYLDIVYRSGTESLLTPCWRGESRANSSLKTSIYDVRKESGRRQKSR